jgi:hypothetical protein
VTVNGATHGHSVVLASVYRVRDPRRMWAQIVARQAQLASIGAHHAVVYESIVQAGLVLVTIGVRHREPVAKLVGSPVLREWFEIAGVEDFPMVFAGEIVEKIDLGVSGEVAPGVVVATFGQVDSVDAAVSRVRGAVERFTDAGVRKLWTYDALDDPREMFVLQEFDDEARARRWIDHPDAAADWMRRPEHGSYPPVFVGTLLDMLIVEPGR